MAQVVPLLSNLPGRTIFSNNEIKAKPPPCSSLVFPGKKISDTRVVSVSKRFAVGYSETIGCRENMEDRLVICGCFGTKEDEDYFAIFDGHSGDKAAAYCANNLHRVLAENLLLGNDITAVFKKTFHEVNGYLRNYITQGGSTAVVALLKGSDLYVANSGDSGAVISYRNKARRITRDHKPTIPEERERIERAGGFVDHKGTLMGNLAVSRSFGDFGSHPYVTCEPDVFGPFAVIDDKYSNYQLLILACDGLWDVVSDQEAVDIALSAPNPEEAAYRLREEASKKESKDNISVVVVFFPHYKSNSSHIQTCIPESEPTSEPIKVENTSHSLPQITLKIPDKRFVKSTKTVEGKSKITKDKAKKSNKTIKHGSHNKSKREGSSTKITVEQTSQKTKTKTHSKISSSPIERFDPFNARKSMKIDDNDKAGSTEKKAKQLRDSSEKKKPKI